MMTRSSLSSSDQGTSAMTRLDVDLKPQQEICLRLNFDPSVAVNEFGHELVLNGVIKISAVGFNERFSVNLVGFLNK